VKHAERHPVSQRGTIGKPALKVLLDRFIDWLRLGEVRTHCGFA